jgi:hypothetical protein
MREKGEIYAKMVTLHQQWSFNFINIYKNIESSRQQHKQKISKNSEEMIDLKCLTIQQL